MNTYERHIFDELVNGDFNRARKSLEAYADYRVKNVKADFGFFKYISEALAKRPANLISLPTNLNGIIVVEDPSFTPVTKRYVLSEEDESVLAKIENTYRVRDKLRDLSINYINGAIFYGASGCGKTAFGKYIAARLGLPFCYLNYASTVDSLIGKTSSNIQRAFDFIKQSPSVFMIDELDAIGGERRGGDTDSRGEFNRVVISVMQALDTFDSDSVLLFATNRIDFIDAALLRRIPIKYEMKPMDEERRIKMVAAYLATVPGADCDTEGIRQFLSAFTDTTNNADIIDSLILWIVDRLSKDLPINMCGSSPDEISLFK